MIEAKRHVLAEVYFRNKQILEYLRYEVKQSFFIRSTCVSCRVK